MVRGGVEELVEVAPVGLVVMGGVVPRAVVADATPEVAVVGLPAWRGARPQPTVRAVRQTATRRARFPEACCTCTVKIMPLDRSTSG